MKSKLPETSTKVITLFPSNIRSITEYSFSEMQTQNMKVVMVSVFSIFLLALIFLQGVTLWYNMQQRQVYADERGNLEKEITYWQQVSDKYQGYRDVYFRIATLQYKLGNKEAAQEYLKKAFELDPNFPDGRVLGAKIGI